MSHGQSAPGRAGSIRAVAASGRERRPGVCGRGPVCFVRTMLAVVLVSLGATAGAQAPAAPAVPPAATGGVPESVPEWRRTDGYPFDARAELTRRLQFMAQAMQLREYCADDKVDAEFVRIQLMRFSRITGREENCASLRDY